MIETRDRDTILSLKNDYLFKAVYGTDDQESKFILTAFLNKILDRKDNPIVELEYKNPFQMRAYADDKETIMDIKAVTDTGEIIDIEMQIAWDKDMPARLIFYHGGIIRQSIKAGEDYDKMKPTITICITNSIAFEETDNYMNNFYFMEECENFKLSEKTRICCIELPKLNSEGRTLEELTPLEICLEYLRCADENDSEYITKLIEAGGKELEMAHEKFQKATQDEILREQAIAREKFQRDMLSIKNRVKEADQRATEADQRATEADQRATEADQRAAEADQRAAEADQRAAEADQRAADADQRLADANRNAEQVNARLMAAASKLRDKGFSDREIAEMLDIPVNDITDK